MPALAGQLTMRDFMPAVREVVGATQGLFFYRTFDYGAVYYSGGHIQQIHGAWPTNGPPFLIVERRFWEQNRDAGRELYELVALDLPSTGRPSALVLLRRVAPAADRTGVGEAE
jgi:hypothetical protein